MAEYPKVMECLLSFVAKTGGIKINEEDKWYNPTKEAKENIVVNIEKIKKYTNRRIKLVLASENEFIGFEPITADEVIVPQHEEETLDESIFDEDSNIVHDEDYDADAKDIEVQGNNYFVELSKIKLNTKKKGTLNYTSWSEAWAKLKATYPNAKYRVQEDMGGLPFFAWANGGMVKVSVEVLGHEHSVWLPIMDNYNKSIPMEKITSTDVNKTIQRALVKAIAMHGLGINVYKGEI